MKISFHVDATLPPHAGEFIQSRCSSEFARFDSVVDEVHVSLADENGPKGGESIRCVVRVQLQRRSDVIIHEQSNIRVNDCKWVRIRKLRNYLIIWVY